MSARLGGLWLLLGWVLLSGTAQATEGAERAQVAELDRVRGEIADQIQLATFDLLDELVYRWTRDPVFERPTPVVLAGLTVPVGLGTGLASRAENHLVTAIMHQPMSHIRLVHCPSCTAIVTHSGPEGTVISRGIDNPEVLEQLGGGGTGRHALFIDVEAEGASLVLRARLTGLTPELPIVWSHTLSHSTNSAALLREPEHLKSAAEAREEYMNALRSRGLIHVPVRLGIRTYALPEQVDGPAGVPAPPFLWLQTGVEISPNDARAWTASVLVGYSFIPQAYQGLMAQARVHRLLTGRARSLTRPDLYLFAGAAVLNVWGPATAPFRRELLTADELLRDSELGDPRTAFGAFQVGLDLRVGRRIGASVFLETAPDLGSSANIGQYLRVFSVNFQTLGTEVTFWF